MCLRFLKRQKVLHCDLKPENILLKEGGRSGIKVRISCMYYQSVYIHAHMNVHVHWHSTSGYCPHDRCCHVCACILCVCQSIVSCMLIMYSIRQECVCKHHKDSMALQVSCIWHSIAQHALCPSIPYTPYLAQMCNPAAFSNHLSQVQLSVAN